MRGRKPVPADKLRAKHGGDKDSGGRKIRDSIDAPKGAPPMPKLLSKEAKAEWTSVTNSLDALGVLATTDGSALQLYIESWQIKQWAFASLNAGSLLVTNTNGTTSENKALDTYRQAAEACGEILAQFGLTPAARERIKITPKATDEAPEFELR